MQMKSMQECKERKIILHLEAVIRSLIVGITPVDLWTSMAEIQGHDSFAAINSLLTDEKQSNFYLLFKTQDEKQLGTLCCEVAVQFLLWRWVPTASWISIEKLHLYADYQIYPWNTFLWHLETPRIQLGFITDLIDYNLFPKFSVKRHLGRLIFLHVSNKRSISPFRFFPPAVLLA